MKRFALHKDHCFIVCAYDGAAALCSAVVMCVVLCCVGCAVVMCVVLCCVVLAVLCCSNVWCVVCFPRNLQLFGHKNISSFFCIPHHWGSVGHQVFQYLVETFMGFLLPFSLIAGCY